MNNTIAKLEPAAITATADQLAADLRDRRNFHDGEACDPFALCPSCHTRGRTAQVARRLAVVPIQCKGD